MDMSNDEYINKDGNFCPHCRSCEIEGGSIEVAGCGANQEVKCNSCGASWLDVHYLAGYTELELPNAT